MKSMKLIGTFSLLLITAACGSGMPDYDATGTFETTEVLVSSVQLYLRKKQLEASVKSVEGQLPDILKQVAALKEEIATAEREKRRVENLLKAGAANQKQLDDAQAHLEVLQKQLVAQGSTLLNSRESLTWQSSSVGVQVAQVEDQLMKCHITSPIAGTVLAKYAEAGELATMGKPLFKVADMEQMYIRAYITSEQLSQVKLGQKVTVFSDYGNDERIEYPGVVTWISDRSEFTPKTILTKDERANLVYAVKVAVKNDGYLKIGMYGGVVFEKGK